MNGKKGNIMNNKTPPKVGSFVQTKDGFFLVFKVEEVKKMRFFFYDIALLLELSNEKLSYLYNRIILGLAFNLFMENLFFTNHSYVVYCNDVSGDMQIVNMEDIISIQEVI